MANWRLGIFNVLSDAAFGYVRSQVRVGSLFKPRPRSDAVGETGNPAPHGGYDGCPVCEIHRHVAEGYLLLEGLAETCRREGRIPEGIGGTIPLAQSHFRQAEEQAVTVGAADASLRLRVVELQGRLRDLADRMDGDLTSEQVPALAEGARAAWQESYGLADGAFRREPPASPETALADDPLYRWLRRVRDEELDAEAAMGELRELLSEKEASHAG